MLLGQLTYYAVTIEDGAQLHHACDSSGFRTRSVYMPTHGYDGMLYRVGEFVLVDHNNDFGVIRVSDMIVLRGLQALTYTYCVKGELYHFKRDKNGAQELHPYSSGQSVVPTSTNLIVHTKKLIRKIMLYPETSNIEDPSEYVLIDYLRPASVIPLKSKDVLVPFYPEKENMVLITSSDGQELWMGYILDVHMKNKTCQVHFYVESTSQSGLWHREHIGHRARETVHWKSILGLAEGVWCGRQWRQQPTRHSSLAN